MFFPSPSLAIAIAIAIGIERPDSYSHLR